MHDFLVRFYTRRAVIIKMTTIQQKCWLSGILGFNLSQEAYIQCTSLIYGDVMHQNRYSQKKQSRKARSKWGTVIARYSKDGEIVAWQVRYPHPTESGKRVQRQFKPWQGGWCRFVGLVVDSITTNRATRPSSRRRSMMLMPNSVLIRLSRYQTM